MEPRPGKTVTFLFTLMPERRQLFYLNIRMSEVDQVDRCQKQFGQP